MTITCTLNDKAYWKAKAFSRVRMRKPNQISEQEQGPTRDLLIPRQMTLRLQKATKSIQKQPMTHVVHWFHSSHSRKASLRDSLLTPVQVYLAQRLSVSTRVLWTLQVAGSTSGSQTLILLFSPRAHSWTYVTLQRNKVPRKCSCCLTQITLRKSSTRVCSRS